MYSAFMSDNLNISHGYLRTLWLDFLSVPSQKLILSADKRTRNWHTHKISNVEWRALVHFKGIIDNQRSQVVSWHNILSSISIEVAFSWLMAHWIINKFSCWIFLMGTQKDFLCKKGQEIKNQSNGGLGSFIWEVVKLIEGQCEILRKIVNKIL